MLSVVDAPSQLPLIASLVADSEKLFWSGRPVVTTSCSDCDEIVCPLDGSVASAFTRTAVCTLPAWTTARTIPVESVTPESVVSFVPPTSVLSAKFTVRFGSGDPAPSLSTNTTIDWDGIGLPAIPMQLGAADTDSSPPSSAEIGRAHV